jgi:hypothetical protein
VYMYVHIIYMYVYAALNLKTLNPECIHTGFRDLHI